MTYNDIVFHALRTAGRPLASHQLFELPACEGLTRQQVSSAVGHLRRAGKIKDVWGTVPGPLHGPKQVLQYEVMPREDGLDDALIAALHESADPDDASQEAPGVTAEADTAAEAMTGPETTTGPEKPDIGDMMLGILDDLATRLSPNQSTDTRDDHAKVTPMKRLQTLVVAIPDPTPEEQVEGHALHDRQILIHSLFHHPWLAAMDEGDWRRGPLTSTKSTASQDIAAHDGAAKPPGEPATTADAIDHPAHYTSHPSGIKPIQITRFESFTRGNAIKYLMRAGRKDPDPRIDLRKARRYIDFELEDLDRQADTEASGAPVA